MESLSILQSLMIWYVSGIISSILGFIFIDKVFSIKNFFQCFLYGIGGFLLVVFIVVMGIDGIIMRIKKLFKNKNFVSMEVIKEFMERDLLNNNK